MSSASVSDYFDHIKDTVNAIDRPVICYDLTDGLSKFFDAGAKVERIGSTKKFAREGDFLISRLRSYLMEMGIVEWRESEQLFSTEFLVFRAKTETLSAQTLFALCLTDTVQTILKRSQYGTEHPRFYDFLMENLPIPDCLLAMDGNIRQIISRASEVRAYSRQLYAAAQSTLLSELGLTDWQPKHQPSFVKSFSQIWQAGRVDSEYFQPKYEAIEEALKSYRNGYVAIREAFAQNESTFHVVPDELYHYVEIGSVNIANGEITPLEVLGRNLPANAKRVLKSGDVIVSKVRPYRGAITIVPQDGYVGSGAFCVLQEKGLINKETLQVFLNSKPLLAWALKPNRGMEYPVIVDDDILDLPIPIIAPEAQAQIREQVAESAFLRRQSRRLLDGAKTAVELAIEQGEAAALAWLEQEGLLG